MWGRVFGCVPIILDLGIKILSRGCLIVGVEGPNLILEPPAYKGCELLDGDSEEGFAWQGIGEIHSCSVV
jgi:hypothetical protein